MVRGMRITLAGALPYSLPDAGETLQISTNTPEVATPPTYTYPQYHGANFGAFGTGGGLCVDYSEYGAFVSGIVGGEGASFGCNNPGILAFDFSTAEWEGRSLAVGGYDYYDVFNDTTETNGYPLREALVVPLVSPSVSTGIPVPGHPYGNNIVLPASLGGGAMGSIISATRSACTVESLFSPAYHRLDIASMEYTHLGTGGNVGGANGSMGNSSSVLDVERGRILHRNNAESRTAIEYLDLNDLGGTPIKGITPGAGSLPQGMDAGAMFMYEGYLIMMGLNAAATEARLFLLDQDSPEASDGGWITLNYSSSDADIMAERATRWQWVAAKGMFYKLPKAGGTTLWTLTPPSLATIKTGGAWTSGTKTIGPSVPATGNLGSGGDAWWAGFFYHPVLECFVWIPARDNGDGTVYLIGVPA
jgi:hypothetical protein